MIDDRAAANDFPTTDGTATVVVTCGPLDTTKLTREPDATCDPAPGSLPVTTPSATVALDCSVTAPTARPR